MRTLLLGLAVVTLLARHGQQGVVVDSHLSPVLDDDLALPGLPARASALIRFGPFDPRAPWWRRLFDLGNWNTSRVVLPAGQSAQSTQPYDFDQNAGWREGRYGGHPFSRAAVERARAHRCILLPWNGQAIRHA